MLRKIFHKVVKVILNIIISLFFIICGYMKTQNIPISFTLIKPNIVMDIQNINNIYDDEFNDYYYSQLTDTQKKLYFSMLVNYNNIISKEEYVKFLGVNVEDLRRVYKALLGRYDIEGCGRFICVSSLFSNSILVTIEGGSRLSSAQLKIVENEAKNILSTINGTEEEIIQGIYNWCTKEISYDTSKSKKHCRDIYGAIVNKECVCTGYAKAFAYLCAKKEIKCIVVSGKDHDWNYVKIDKNYYAVDTTWGKMNTKKYLLDGKSFLENEHHIPEFTEEFILPRLADKSFFSNKCNK